MMTTTTIPIIPKLVQRKTDGVDFFKMVNTLGVKTKNFDYEVQSEFTKPMKRIPFGTTKQDGNEPLQLPRAVKVMLGCWECAWIFHWILSKRLTGFTDPKWGFNYQTLGFHHQRSGMNHQKRGFLPSYDEIGACLEMACISSKQRNLTGKEWGSKPQSLSEKDFKKFNWWLSWKPERFENTKTLEPPVNP